ncbi:ImmA/IrrE family metallo-endopeptidase [Leucobacter allii]|uniref:ImmA/IrrE family metallo-endopeptidase n=1 Tax=Leucobacter allii TaxID=2932247 RepID=A0ABY4FJE5_9MICO|nr:ImmA/IrrE family metallo-endopeptidase [Leucobacter allii]UOQ56042.1 ImmA/IrrE family metallo-endopeptidase [Leucobacter allii]
MQNLHALAALLDVTIDYDDLTHLGRDGDYDRRTRTIRLQRGMLYRLERSVLAHELIHVIRDDEKTMFGFYDARDERIADELAGYLLFEISEYRLAEEKCGSHIEGIALELGVMGWVIEAFQRSLDRLGESVYVHGRMGVGQFVARFEAVA